MRGEDCALTEGEIAHGYLGICHVDGRTRLQRDSSIMGINSHGVLISECCLIGVLLFTAHTSCEIYIIDQTPPLELPIKMQA